MQRSRRGCSVGVVLKMAIYQIRAKSRSGSLVELMSTSKEIRHWLKLVEFEPAEFYNAGQAGDCYQTAIIMLMHVSKSKPESVEIHLCHGICNIASGSRGGHAWCEITYDGKVWTVDASSIVFPIRIASQEEYYQQLMVKAELVDRYSVAEVWGLVDRFGESLHCGPWRMPRDTEHNEEFDQEFVFFLPHVGSESEPEMMKSKT